MNLGMVKNLYQEFTGLIIDEKELIYVSSQGGIEVDIIHIGGKKHVRKIN
jgi:hypothetical protein